MYMALPSPRPTLMSFNRRDGEWSVYQLEKGLPPNGVVPVLKAKVEEMKDKVHMVHIYNKSQHIGYHGTMSLSKYTCNSS